MFRMALEMPVDRDVARVADLLGQVYGVENVLRLEVLVLLGLAQVAKVNGQTEILERHVDESGVS